MKASKRSYRDVVLAILLIYATIPIGTAGAVEFAGGTGDPNDPYQIATAEQLIAIGGDPNLQCKCYLLINDIDLDPHVFDAAVLNMRYSDPRGGTGEAGMFDGNGHVIRNLVIDAPEEETIGLFGSIHDKSEVRNLGLENVRVAGRRYVGALAGTCSNSIMACYATGNVSGQEYVGGLIGRGGEVVECHWSGSVMGLDFVGGLVGDATFGVVERSSANGTVVGQDGVGGLAGSGSVVISCHSGGIVSGEGGVGGLIGVARGASEYASNQGPRGFVLQCHSTASVSGLTSTGGLVGQSNAIVTGCYATGSALALDTGGALVGTNYGVLEACYATGQAIYEGRMSGLVGDNDGTISRCFGLGRLVANMAGTISQSYYLAPAWDERSWTFPEGQRLTLTEALDPANFIGWDFHGLIEDGYADHWHTARGRFPALSWQTDITGLCAIPYVVGLPLQEAQARLLDTGFTVGPTTYAWHRNTEDFHPDNHEDSYGYGAIRKDTVIFTTPMHVARPGEEVALTVSLGPYDWSANQGNGTAESPYIIETAGQLDSLGDLAASSDAGTFWNSHFMLTGDIDMYGRPYSRSPIAPDGGLDDTAFDGTAFGGTFDGSGHKIANLMITGYGSDYLGLFGMLDPNALVMGLTLENIVISGRDSIGALAGRNDGTIVDVEVTTHIFGRNNLGGLVGQNRGVISDAHVIVTLDGDYVLGGVMGCNDQDLGTYEDCSAIVTTVDDIDVGELVGGSQCGNTVSRR